MANEYLKRTPTSTGNRRVFTWSGWIKINSLSGTIRLLNSSPTKDNLTDLRINTAGSIDFFDRQGSDASTEQVRWVPLLRDFGSWYHILINADTTQIDAANRVRAFVNGVELSRDAANTLLNNSVAVDTPPRNQEFHRLNGSGNVHYIGANLDNSLDTFNRNEFTDIFFIDGQALTPDVFGKYIEGNGYISAGTTQATNFKKGQWVPKSPKVIKSVINARGGFGVNGFYLPMNDSSNFGADFHCEPNSIIKLQENLAQPRCRIDGSGTYITSLRDDPFKQYLIFAQPNVSGGLQNGYGDYSHVIRGSGDPKTITGGTAGTPAISTTQSLYYGSSLYFDGNDTLNVETNNLNYLGGDFTIEFWIWHDSAYPINQMIFNTEPHTSFGISLNRAGSGQTALYIGNGTTWQTADFRSGGRLYSQQWNHVVVERHNNAITIYHNGVAQGTTTAVMPTGFSSLFRYGTYDNNSGEPVLGYIQDYRVYSGVAKYTGGFDVPKPYTPVGIATWRAVPDTTANNFATWNPVSPTVNGSQASFTNGNLTVSDATSNGSQGSATIGVSTGKWYYEAIATVTGSGTNLIGIRPAEWFTFNAQNRTAYRNNGDVYTDNGNISQTGATYTSNDIIGVAFDMDNKRLWFSKNGSWVYSGDPNNNLNPAVSFASTYTHYTPFFAFDNAAGTESWTANFGQNPTFSGNTTAGTFTDSNGKGLFKYQPPSGFLALCEDNLPTPAISDPGEHFKAVLYTGDGNSGRSIVGVGFTPDLVWIKDRNNGSYNHLISDSVRGSGFALRPSATTEETASGIRAFSADGFSISSDLGYNVSGNNHVAWCWKAGNGTQTNTNGSITSVVSVNQDAGFSIVSYTGTGANATVGHGLGKVPKFMMIKNRTASDGWINYHSSIGPTGYLQLNTTGATSTLSTVFNNTAPTSSVFSVGTVSNTNGSGINLIAYCWSEIEGFSKFGSYVGNGSADGPFVYCGFKPAFVITKRIDSTSSWHIIDNSRNSTNPNQARVWAEISSAEVNDTTNPFDFLSNGFKLRGTGTGTNASGGSYIFAAFAESPFKTANAK